MKTVMSFLAMSYSALGIGGSVQSEGIQGLAEYGVVGAFAIYLLWATVSDKKNLVKRIELLEQYERERADQMTKALIAFSESVKTRPCLYPESQKRKGE